MKKVNNTYRPPNLNNGSNDMSMRILKRIMIAGIVFLVLNIIIFLPPVHNRIEASLFSNIKGEGQLENQGIGEIKEGEDENAVIKSSLETCLVRVKQGNRQACGVIWDMNETEAVIATAGHAVEDEQEPVLITFFNEKQVSADVIYKAEQADLVFLSVKPEDMQNFSWYDYTYVKLDEADEALKAEAELLFLQEDGQVQRAKVLNPLLYMEDFGEKMIWAEALAIPGMSGCGVFDTTGSLKGILCGGNEQNEIAVLPVRTMQEEYENSGRSRTQ